jgi:glycosyltransferase involved in cell wall biosynthesis
MPDGSRQPGAGRATGSVAYILKGFPRLSETFIASEIYRMEREGLRLRLYSIQPFEDNVRHEIVDRIQAKPVYLPRTTSLRKTSLFRWLALHLRDFLPGLKRAALRHPVKVARAAAVAFAQAVRARRTFWSWPRKIYLKEFLQAATLADLLAQARDVRHIHAHFCHRTTTVAWLASIMTGLPFSFTAHAKDLYSPSLNPAGLLRRKMDAARFVVTCTEANRNYLQQQGSSTPVYCVYHGLNADFCQLLQESPNSASRNGHLRALAVGRLIRKKGFDVFVEACAILHQRGTSFEAFIAGESGEQEEEIRRLIAAHGLEGSIQLTGPLSQARLLEEYQRATVFCLPCRILENGDRDGIPNVLVEAMACGLPVITTPISGIPEVIEDGINGLLVPPDNPEALAAQVLRLRQDVGLTRRLSREAQATVEERFNGDKFAARLAALFREALA